jgi:hypothetical protein
MVSCPIPPCSQGMGFSWWVRPPLSSIRTCYSRCLRDENGWTLFHHVRRAWDSVGGLALRCPPLGPAAAYALEMKMVGNGRKNTQIISDFIFPWQVRNGNRKAGIGIIEHSKTIKLEQKIDR